MLYGTFVIFVMLMSVIGIIHMLAFETYTYIIFPITTLVWGFYKFFKEDDDEFCRRNGVNNSSNMGWLIGLDDNEDYYGPDGVYYGGYYGGSGYNRQDTSSHHRTVAKTYNYQNPEYKKLLPRCRRNSLVTTDKFKTKQQDI
jgi:hypothetical protein